MCFKKKSINMKITVFTSNSRRHNYLINSLTLISDELFLIPRM